MLCYGVGCCAADPTEHHDLAQSLPLIVTQLRERLQQINRTVFSPVRGGNSPLGCKVALQKYGGFWGPFADQGFAPPPPTPPPPPPPPSPMPAECEQRLAAICPRANFSEYEGCRQCISDVMKDPERAAILGCCKPAAPGKYQRYCCAGFPHPANPSINCSSSGDRV